MRPPFITRTKEGYALNIPAATSRYAGWRISQQKLGPNHRPSTYLQPPEAPAALLKRVAPREAIELAVASKLAAAIAGAYCDAGAPLDGLQGILEPLSEQRALYVIELPVAPSEHERVEAALASRLAGLRTEGVDASALSPASAPEVIVLVVENLGEPLE